MRTFSERSVKNFKPHYEEDRDGEPSEDTSVRRFTGRMTKGRWKAIRRWCRTHSWRREGHCHHDYDCCGCLFATHVWFTYKHNQVSVFITQHRNY